ncbi:MAG: hypothetical protein JNM56_15180 [Planctomycetia bacterium]|nr:hypothetical protein [Planctomycetia bacterium]
MLNLTDVKVLLEHVAQFRAAIRGTQAETELARRVYLLEQAIEDVGLESARCDLTYELQWAYLPCERSTPGMVLFPPDDYKEHESVYDRLKRHQEYFDVISRRHTDLHQKYTAFQATSPSQFAWLVSTVRFYRCFVNHRQGFYAGLPWWFDELLACAEDFFPDDPSSPFDPTLFSESLAAAVMQWVAKLREIRDRVRPHCALECAIVERCQSTGFPTEYGEELREFDVAREFAPNPTEFNLWYPWARDIAFGPGQCPQRIVSKALADRIVTAATKIVSASSCSTAPDRRPVSTATTPTAPVGPTDSGRKWHSPADARPAEFAFGPLPSQGGCAGALLAEALVPSPSGTLRKRPELDHLLDWAAGGTIWLVRHKPKGKWWSVWFNTQAEFERAEKRYEALGSAWKQRLPSRRRPNKSRKKTPKHGR